MTIDEFEYLKTENARHQTQSLLEADPLRLALGGTDRRVVSLIKVLQKCQKKLPSYYAAHCIADQRAYEQCSSEATAGARTLGGGELAIDLTCGLGVDTVELSHHFRHVISVEIDPVRATMARYNFELLGAKNIEVVENSAEDFTTNLTPTTPIDLIYVDPSRRSENASRVYSLEDSSPNILELMPLLRQKAKMIAIKLSPLFDIAQIFRLFEGSSVEIISLDGECKEVIAHTPQNDRAAIRLTAIRSGRIFRFDFTNDFTLSPTTNSTSGNYNYLHQPDVAFYKSRTLKQYMATHYPTITSLCEDYIFTDQPLTDFCGTSYIVDKQMAYQPKAVARELKARGIKRADILLRNFPYTAANITRSLGISQGGNEQIVCTIHRGAATVFFVHLAK